MSDISIIAIAITSVIIVLIICVTLVHLQKGKNERTKDRNETEKEIAKVWSECNTKCEIKTGHISTKKDADESYATYKNDENNDTSSNPLFTTMSSFIFNLFSQSKANKK